MENKNIYDEVPYPSLPYAQSHPNRLATVAALLGLESAPVTRCRVLELGCAAGGNLIPMAYGLPNSRFVGIDYSVQQIGRAQQLVKGLGLDNINFKHLDILQAGPELGQFDYIIAHGVYSWTPPPVRDAVLQICQQNLAANGVAYVSYNTLPGWSMLQAARQMMLYHTRITDDPRKKAAQAREFLDFMTEAVAHNNNAYASFFQKYTNVRLKEHEAAHEDSDAFLLHDELEAVNEPVYFYQFAEHAAAHGLQYLGEAKFSSMMPRKIPADVIDAVNKMSTSLIDYEQYLDFLRNRTFRRTLLCHQGVTVSRKLNPAQLLKMHAGSMAAPVSSPVDVVGATVEEFRAPNEATFSTDHPISKAALLYLGRIWPEAVAFNDLLKEAQTLLLSQGVSREILIANTARDAEVLATNLLTAYGYSAQLTELHIHPPNLTTTPGERPLASRLARWQIANGLRPVTNLRHERVTLNEFQRQVIPYLDGHHTFDMLVDVLVERVEAGELRLENRGESVTKERRVENLLANLLTQTMSQLVSKALLMQ